ncbi:MAG TPA: flippase activity-associated protein Agl23 [Vicinamibacterales bacterium]|nr:flippase activity-associated protein Agl23 [Vicinamibacterales bacterium]
MTRGSAGALVAVALVSGLALRCARLDARPMHHDEANQAVKFGALLEHGEYRYDFRDHHGPTLYYLTLPAAAVRGQTTLASLDEWTLRGVPAAFGAASILLLSLLTPAIGRTAVALGAWLLALSPAMVFYSRMFIQEPLFACFTLAFLIASGRLATGGGSGWAVMTGAALGLMVATKETSAIVVPAALVACALAAWSMPRTESRPRIGLPTGRLLLAAIVGAVLVAALFYSSFFTNPAGLVDPFRAALTYLDRGIAPENHVQPWHYYLGLLAYSSSGGLTWSEGLVLVLAAVGAASALRTVDPAQPLRAFWTRYLAAYVVLALAIFSAIRYKTPWNLLPFYIAAIALAGIGFAAVLDAARSRFLRVALTAAAAMGTALLGWQAWRASVVYAADPRNPYVYAQTVPDAVRMAARIRDLAALHPSGTLMQVSVFAPPHEQWPLPWYLRTMPNVGYWTEPGDPLAMQAPVIVSSMRFTAALDEVLGDAYVSEFYGLRPDVLQVLYVERGLWDRLLASVTGSAGLSGGGVHEEPPEGGPHHVTPGGPHGERTR